MMTLLHGFNYRQYASAAIRNHFKMLIGEAEQGVDVIVWVNLKYIARPHQ